MASIADFAGAQPPVYHQERESKYGLSDWLTTVDHKKIGILYGISGLAGLAVGGLEALLFRIQLAQPDQHIFVGDQFNGLVTMHATTMVFMAVMPLIAAISNYFVPLMIGARDVAFPRLNAFSYWTFLFGVLLMHSSLIFAEFPAAGWTGYAPLTTKPYGAGGIDFWWAGLAMLAISSMIAGVNFVVTILNMRAPGMTLMRVPVLAWMILVVQFLLAFSFPPVTVGLILLAFDRTFGSVFYETSMGGDPHLWQHLFWLFGHPEVYVLILPSMGIVSEVLPVFSRKPLFGHHAVIFSGIFIGFVGFGVWGHHMFTSGMGPIADAAFAVTTAIIAVPTGVKIFNWLGTLVHAKMRLTTAMLFAVTFIPQFTIGGLSGVMHASPPLDLQQHDSYFVVAHFHYVLVGGALTGLFAGAYFYLPKITGRLLDETLGKIHFWMFIIGFNLTFFPMHLLGNNGMPRRIFTYPADAGWNTENMIGTIGVVFQVVSVLIFFYNMMVSSKKGAVAGSDPWDANTLEWMIPSPPPVHNFDFTPVVLSERPLWDHKYTPGFEITVPAQREEIHMPSYSWRPIIVSGFVLLVLIGLLSHIWALSVVGGVGIVVGVYFWVSEPV
ncbi:MAG: cytochrome ubiquinol oxidase subunit I [Myxococcales bacterium]|nr:cytochrome ubiquinol oxidase subunit I [Myxococcales bacterium]